MGHQITVNLRIHKMRIHLFKYFNKIFEIYLTKFLNVDFFFATKQ